ncbi:biotin/lipoyl-containing protein [Pseudoalteromonas sp. DL-6]|uniref:biotin/lipoyl-containing protein n=1 Tax=Pseudoalteromonas sp. DL-6 TaxID=1390185 RepID=UPI00103DE2A8|nr:biotin/lipoyl-containing protein [Pseudoalteromonas sp. DL-6]QBJ63082.1 hypothetical protein B1F84_08525 [Pseudoalteromonas sp. DL-6]
MSREIKIPILPDSVATAKITNLYVNEGQLVYLDDVLFDVETEKIVLEVMADCNGIIENITIVNGDHVNTEQVVMTMQQLADSDMPARPTAQQPQPRVNSSENYVIVSPWLSKLNKSLIIALAIGALAILFVLGI